VRRAVEEDVGGGDATTLALVPEGVRATAQILARGDYVVSGVGVAMEVFRRVDSAIRGRAVVADGERVGEGGTILELEGSARGLLTAERTALNFMQRMTGIATLTRRFVEQVQPFGVAILDTRKTTPTLRILEKYAVRCGGGENHRMGLYDRVLIKDNHRRLWRRDEASHLDEAVREARRRFPGLAVEVEVETLEELDSALRADPDWILLDNLDSRRLREFARRSGGRCKLEASGGIALANVADVAKSGVHAISLGCLTHSAPAADLSMEMA
jgi:nicotinate-nucleotide pyrophosphorylase (carboxylating)